MSCDSLKKWLGLFDVKYLNLCCFVIIFVDVMGNLWCVVFMIFLVRIEEFKFIWYCLIVLGYLELFVLLFIIDLNRGLLLMKWLGLLYLIKLSMMFLLILNVLRVCYIKVVGVLNVWVGEVELCGISKIMFGCLGC